MDLLALIAASALVLAVAYRTYGAFLFRWLRTDGRDTPAVALNDGRDFVPAPAGVATGQHFTAIAAAGPIVGPILAGMYFGWGPALAWILLGAIFIGGAHDMGALFASLRHRAGSIVQVVRTRMSARACTVFLVFVWMSLVYVIIAFTDLTASTFARVVEFQLAGGGEGGDALRVAGGGVATAALAYLVVSVVLGLAMRRAGLPVWAAAVIGTVCVGLAIWFGQRFPLALPFGDDAWDLVLLGYCFLASVLPLWLLLQPRGLLGAVFLYGVIAAGCLGVVAGAFTGGNVIRQPAFLAFDAAQVGPLVPFLFITIACGACSGFHAIVASGTTARQVARERDVKPVAYGAMLLEAMVAVLALSTVMLLAPETRPGTPDAVFAQGIGTFLGHLGVPVAFAVTFGLLAFSTFVFDTLDVCTRLGRYVFQEMTGLQGRGAGLLATAATLAFPAAYLAVAEAGAWRQFWIIFGTSNQLLAALTLIGLAVWFRSLGRNPWPVLGPAVFMLAVTGLALAWNLRTFASALLGWTEMPRALTPLTLQLNLGIAAALAGLACFVTWEAVRALRRAPDQPAP